MVNRFFLTSVLFFLLLSRGALAQEQADKSIDNFPYIILASIDEACKATLQIKSRKTNYEKTYLVTEGKIRQILLVSPVMALAPKAIVISEVGGTLVQSGEGMLFSGVVAKILNFLTRSTNALTKRKFIFFSIVNGGLWPFTVNQIKKINLEDQKNTNSMIHKGFMSFYVYEEDIPNLFKNVDALIKSARMKDGDCLANQLAPYYSNLNFTNHLMIAVEASD